MLKMDEPKDDERKWQKDDKFTPEFKEIINEEFRHMMNRHSIDVLARESDRELAAILTDVLEQFVGMIKYVGLTLVEVPKGE